MTVRGKPRRRTGEGHGIDTAPIARPGGPPVPGRSAPLLLPLLALAALVLTGGSVFLPWRDGMSLDELGISSTGLGLGLLAASAVLAVPPVIDLFTARVRVLGLVAVPGLVAAAGAATFAVGSAVVGESLPSLDLGGVGAELFGVGAVGLVGVGGFAAWGFVRGWDGAADEQRPPSSGHSPVLVGLAVGGVVVLGAALALGVLGVLGVLTPSSSPGTPARTSGSPATFTGTTGTTPGPRPHVDPVAPSSGDTMPSTPCPAEAATTMPEATGAVVVAHDDTVHVALCRSAAGRLYYYGANDRTHLTITLPARRSEDSWIAENQGTTYFLTEDALEILRPSRAQTDQALQGGW